jgi:hypothetical protein
VRKILPQKAKEPGLSNLLIVAVDTDCWMGWNRRLGGDSLGMKVPEAA